LVITVADIIAWVYSLDLAHRGSSGAAIIVSPNTAEYMRGIVDGNGRPIMLDQPMRTVPMGDEAFGSTQPVQFLSVPTLFGIPVLESKATAISNLGPGNTVGVFANLASAFVIRVASSCEVQVLQERWADYGELGYIGRARVDGAMLDPAASNALVAHA
jgi:HK97 family phage major capsid protein